MFASVLRRGKRFLYVFIQLLWQSRTSRCVKIMYPKMYAQGWRFVVFCWALPSHNSDVITSAMESQVTGVPFVCSGADQRKHQSSASLPFVREIHQFPVNPSHKGPVTRKMFSFDGVIMCRFYTYHIYRYIYIYTSALKGDFWVNLGLYSYT